MSGSDQGRAGVEPTEHTPRDRPVAAPDPTRELLEALEIRRVDDVTFVGQSLPQLNGRVFGGQVLAQGLIAAGRTVPSDRLPHSLHGYFLRAGAVDQPITSKLSRSTIQMRMFDPSLTYMYLPPSGKARSKAEPQYSVPGAI